MDFATALVEKSSLTGNAGDGNGREAVGGNHESGLRWTSRQTPFLMKTYEMVENTETNKLISWSSSGTSVIVWDRIMFSAKVLPMYFKSSNFSSFVFQLHNYGFRRISGERYEYANQWFQAGKKHLLKNIKRRYQNQPPQSTKKRGRFTSDHKMTDDTTKTKLHAMMTEQIEMKGQVQKLRQRLENSEDQITSLETNTISAVMFKQFMQYLREKKPRIAGPSSIEITTQPAEKTEISTKDNSSSADDSASSMQDQKLKKTIENAEECPWKKMLEDDAGFKSYEQQGESLAPHHSRAIVELDEMLESNIAMQSENLIAKPSNSGMEEEYVHLELWT